VHLRNEDGKIIETDPLSSFLSPKKGHGGMSFDRSFISPTTPRKSISLSSITRPLSSPLTSSPNKRKQQDSSQIPLQNNKTPRHDQDITPKINIHNKSPLSSSFSPHTYFGEVVKRNNTHNNIPQTPISLLPPSKSFSGSSNNEENKNKEEIDKENLPPTTGASSPLSNRWNSPSTTGLSERTPTTPAMPKKTPDRNSPFRKKVDTPKHKPSNYEVLVKEVLSSVFPYK